MVADLTKAQVKALFSLMKQNNTTPELNTIVHNHGYAYYTNKFTAIRWRLDEKSGLKDGYFIDLNNRTDVDKSLAMWMKLATARQMVDLDKESLWNDPDEWVSTFSTDMHSAMPYPSSVFRLFDSRRAVKENEDTSAVFNFEILKELGVLLNSDKNTSMLYFVPISDNQDRIDLSMHYVIGNDENVVSVLKPMIPSKGGKRPVVTYEDIMSGNDGKGWR